ncbi:hypothetical protein TNCV_2972191 [Trichonephila clavipes]|nr:hypothetical protein TNCV_2972191 [Trichonephila clavipes]
MVMVDTHVWIASLMVDNDESVALTVDLTINLSSRSAVAHRSTATIITLKSDTVHSLLSASSNDRITSTHMTSDSPICITCLFQSNDTTSFKLGQLLVMSSNPVSILFFSRWKVS